LNLPDTIKPPLLEDEWGPGCREYFTYNNLQRVDTKNRSAFASQGQADNVCIVEVGPTSKPLPHRFRASQFFFDARFVHGGIIVQE
jgi:hypothetical protein